MSYLKKQERLVKIHNELFRNMRKGH